MRIAALVPAGGSGKRIRQATKAKEPKQFWALGKRSILQQVLVTLAETPCIDEIVVAVPREYVARCRKEIAAEPVLKRVSVVAGGAERVDSVSRCLRAVSSRATHILIQDGVRPFLTRTLIERVVKALKKNDGVIAARPVVPTLKKVVGGRIVETVDRSPMWEAETPQFFTRALLKKAFSSLKKAKGACTDEASLVEAVGGRVAVCHCEEMNMKITTSDNYALAQAFCAPADIRVGQGYDVHRLVTGRKLMLGGLEIPFHKGSLGHSDGDCLLHAITDALLGAAALGDIGEHFPDTGAKCKNMDSSLILKKTLQLLARAQFEVATIDATVILERPKLATYKNAIREEIARIVSLPLDCVNVKAKTNEGLDSVGDGFAVSAQAVVTIHKK